ncbi:hypothetical protein IFM89_023402, partial [Coptis chinensis]
MVYLPNEITSKILSTLPLNRHSRLVYIVEEEDVHRYKKSTKINLVCPHCMGCYAKPYVSGHLCFFSDKSGIHVYNPGTRDCVKLPDLPLVECGHPDIVLGLGLDRSGNEFKVVQLLLIGDNLKSEAYMHTLGSNLWRKVDDVPNVRCFSASYALVNGSLHWLTYSYRILSLDLTCEKIWAHSAPLSSLYLMPDLLLADLGGCLSICGSSSIVDTSELWIMKDYNDKESWTRLIIRTGDVMFGM